MPLFCNVTSYQTTCVFVESVKIMCRNLKWFDSVFSILKQYLCLCMLAANGYNYLLNAFNWKKTNT